MAEDVNRGSRGPWLSALHRIHYTQFENLGEKSAAFKEHAKTRPGRVKQAARTLPKKMETQYENTQEWLAARPQGGGRGVAAPHSQWVQWGSQNPNRQSMAGRTLAQQPRKEKQ